MSYCFMRMEKIKTETSFTNKYAHNFRTMNVPNADPLKKENNEELISLPEGETYYSIFKRKVKESPAYSQSKPRKDAVKGIEVLLAYNASEVGSDFDKERWKEENKKWLQDTFGKDNVISAVLHEDEIGGPHIHAIVLPFGEEGRLNAKKYTGGKKALSELQNSYGKAMETVGLKRGLQYSKAEHRDISRYYAALNETVSCALPEPEPGETAYEYRERANQIYVDSNLNHLGEVFKLNRKIDEAKTMDINEKIELMKLRKQIKASAKVEKQAQRFEEVLNGLKHGYFKTPEENENFKKQMQEISKWEREIGKEKDVAR